MFLLPDTTANTILAAIKDTLVRLTLDLEDCRGQAYDGAANFQGHLGGVSAQLQKDFESALSVHCLAHCINLSLQGAVRSVQALRDALDFAMEVIQLITASPKRQILFENIKANKGENATGIRPLCPTRWTVKATAMKSLLDNYLSLQETLDTVAQGHDEYSTRASGLLALMQKFSTYFGLKLSLKLFSVTETLSTTLQAKDTTCDEAADSVDITIRTLRTLRSDDHFANFYDEVSEAALQVQCDPATLPRRRRPPARLDDGSEPHVFTSVCLFYRQQYLQAIDYIIENIQQRFDQKTFGVVKSVEDLLLKAAKGEQVDIPDDVVKRYISNSYCMYIFNVFRPVCMNHGYLFILGISDNFGL